MEQRIVYKPYVEELDNNDSLFINQGNTLRQIKKNKTGFVTTEDLEEEVAPMVYGAYINKSASGPIASFSDGGDGVPMKKCLVNITPKQSGTGTPSPDNVRPISGWESVVLTDAGKNVFSGTTKNNKNLNGSGNEETDYSRSCTTAINVDAGKAYTISYTENVDCGVFYYDKNNTFLSLQGWAANPRTFTLPENTAFVRFSFKQGTAPTNIQVEHGTTATSYAPYTGTTTTVNLGRTVYGGTLDVVSGVLTAYPFYPSYNGETLNGRWVCDRAVYAEGTTPPTGSQVALISGTGTTYQLTPTEVNTLLGENNVWADAGAVEVTYRADPTLAYQELANAVIALGGNL